MNGSDRPACEMKDLRVLAYAKLNLVLRVVGRREDGYHLLQSLVTAVDWADEILLSPRLHGVELEAPPGIGPMEENLAFRAACALLGDDGPGVSIVLRKRIPPGAGLGGGSSDAAAVLAGVNELFRLGRSQADLRAIGARLGADVPFFLGPSPAWVEGIGDTITPADVPLPAAFLILVPLFSCPTPDVYRAFDELCLPLSSRMRPEWGGMLANDLWPAAVHLFPDLLRLRDGLAEVAPGPVGMTGSGSALFAPFPSREKALMARERLRLPPGAQALVAAPVGAGYKFAR